jgi:uncharacterized protein (TIGR00297 family)
MNVESWRRIEHIIPFAFSFLLPYLKFWQAVLLCVTAIFYALFISFHFETTRESERTSRFTTGKFFYALSILITILLFFPDTGVIAAGWAALAIGDSFANMAGSRWGRARLPWNRKKSWLGTLTFLVVSIPSCYGALLWHSASARHPAHVLRLFETSSGFSISARYPSPALILCVVLAMLAGAVVESLPAVLNDNLTVPIVSSSVLAWLLSSQPFEWSSGQSWILACAVSGGFALAAGLLGLIRWSGALAGGLLGAVVFFCMGPAGFAGLILFFSIGTASTFWGFRQKAKSEIAEPNRGRRGVASTLAKGALAVLLALGHNLEGPGRAWLAVGFVAALATATFDTVATELGQIYGKTAHNPWTWKRVTPGTEGAVSIQGTLLGFAAALPLVLVPVYGGWFGPGTALICWISALFAGIIESLLASRTRGLPEVNAASRGHWLNFFTTAVGAALAMMGKFWLD